MFPLAQAQPPPLPPPTALEAITESLASQAFWFQMFVVVVCAPIWFPILRAIYREIDRSLRPEGGVFAREYSPRELEVLEQRDGPHELPLKSVPRVDPLRRNRGQRSPAGGSAAPAGGGAPGRAGRTGRGLRSTRGRGF